jgi:hypothetical protein
VVNIPGNDRLIGSFVHVRITTKSVHSRRDEADDVTNPTLIEGRISRATAVLSLCRIGGMFVSA